MSENVAPPSVDRNICPWPEPVTPSPTQMMLLLSCTTWMSHGLLKPGLDSSVHVEPKLFEMYRRPSSGPKYRSEGLSWFISIGTPYSVTSAVLVVVQVLPP